MVSFDFNALSATLALATFIFLYKTNTLYFLKDAFLRYVAYRANWNYF